MPAFPALSLAISAVFFFAHDKPQGVRVADNYTLWLSDTSITACWDFPPPNVYQGNAVAIDIPN